MAKSRRSMAPLAWAERSQVLNPLVCSFCPEMSAFIGAGREDPGTWDTWIALGVKPTGPQSYPSLCQAHELRWPVVERIRLLTRICMFLGTLHHPGLHAR